MFLQCFHVFSYGFPPRFSTVSTKKNQPTRNLLSEASTCPSSSPSRSCLGLRTSWVWVARREGDEDLYQHPPTGVFACGF